MENFNERNLELGKIYEQIKSEIYLILAKYEIAFSQVLILHTWNRAEYEYEEFLEISNQQNLMSNFFEIQTDKNIWYMYDFTIGIDCDKLEINDLDLDKLKLLVNTHYPTINDFYMDYFESKNKEFLPYQIGIFFDNHGKFLVQKIIQT